MKVHHMFIGLLAVIASAQALAQGKSSNLVLLRVDEAGTALEYHAQGSDHGVCNNPGKGCVRITGNGDVTFRLVSQRNCDDQGAKWELSGVQLGGVGSSSKPGTWGGLPADVAADFSADAQGWASISSAQGGGVVIRDDNTSENSLWYRVEATCSSDGSTIEFDPRFENDGTGSR